jgi:hypothetical protein
MEIIDIKNAEVDESLLVLPEGYQESVLPGMEDMVKRSADGGAKWKARPRSRLP